MGDKVLIIGIDAASPRGDVQGWAICKMEGQEIVMVEYGLGEPPNLESYIDAGTLTVGDGREAAMMRKIEHLPHPIDDTIKGGRDRVGGPPAHTLKSYSRKRSER